MKIYLTSENYIKTKTNIDSNIDSKFIQAALDEAHIRLEELIGTKLFNHLVEKIKNMEEFNNKEKKLMSLIQSFLAYNVISVICVTASYHISNNGIYQASDEHIENAKYDDVVKIKDFYEHKVEDYQNKIIRYILNEINYFNKFISQERIYDFRMNIDSSANANIWLGGLRGRTIQPYENLRDKYDK